MRDQDEQIALKLGAALRELRRTRGWSQATLAEKLDVSVDYVGLLERGERLPALGMLVHVARTLGVQVEVLLGAPLDVGWAEEAIALLKTLPEEARNLVLAMLRGAVAEQRGKRGPRSKAR
jgi:transcriptional regulator with XRE-family HTH domain